MVFQEAVITIDIWKISLFFIVTWLSLRTSPKMGGDLKNPHPPWSSMGQVPHPCSKRQCCRFRLYPSFTGEAEAWGFLCDLLSALQHLHSQGFVHLDLKPANVFLTRSGRLKLGDFGLMLRLGCGDSGREKSELEEGQEGDPRYMAPELLRGQYSLAADIFRYGCSPHHTVA